MVQLKTGRMAPSRGHLFMVVGFVLLVFGLASLESIGGSFRDLFRGQPQDPAWVLVLGGLVAMGWGWVRTRLELKQARLSRESGQGTADR